MSTCVASQNIGLIAPARSSERERECCSQRQARGELDSHSHISPMRATLLHGECQIHQLAATLELEDDGIACFETVHRAAEIAEPIDRRAVHSDDDVACGQSAHLGRQWLRPRSTRQRLRSARERPAAFVRSLDPGSRPGSPAGPQGCREDQRARWNRVLRVQLIATGRFKV